MKELHPHTKWRGTISNIILGISDGMVVSIAFLTGTALNVANLRLVIITGVAALISNMVSMFFSGILAKRTEIALFKADYNRELYEIEHEPKEEKQEMIDLYTEKGLGASDARKLVSKITKNKRRWLEDMLLNELHVHRDSLGSPIQAGATIGVASFIGGFVPLAPYIFVGGLHTAITISLAISFGSLFAVGAIKGWVTKSSVIVSGCEMLVVGIAASLIVFGIGKVLAFA